MTRLYKVVTSILHWTLLPSQLAHFDEAMAMWEISTRPGIDNDLQPIAGKELNPTNHHVSLETDPSLATFSDTTLALANNLTAAYERPQSRGNHQNCAKTPNSQRQ